MFPWKKVLAIFLAMTLVFSFAGCDEQDDDDDDDRRYDRGWANHSKDTTSESSKMPKFDKTATIQETTLYSKDNVSITAQSLEYSDYSVTVNFIIENSASQTLNFAINNCAVNGMMISVPSYNSTAVQSGKKAKKNLSINIGDLQKRGIHAVADIAFVFDIRDESYNHIYTDVCELKSSLADSYEKSPTAFQDTIQSKAAQKAYNYQLDFFDAEKQYNHGVNILSRGLMTGSSQNKTLVLEVQNTTSVLVDFRVNNMKVNNLIISEGTIYSATQKIFPGASAIIYRSLSDNIDSNWWELLGLQEIASVEVDVSAYNEDGDALSEDNTVRLQLSDKEGSFDTSGTVLYKDNTTNVILKKIVEDENDYSDTVHILLLVENKYEKNAVFAYKYDSFSVNEFMIDCTVPSVTITPGCFALIDIALTSADLKELDVKKIEDIKTFEGTFVIRDESYKTLNTLTLSNN